MRVHGSPTALVAAVVLALTAAGAGAQTADAPTCVGAATLAGGCADRDTAVVPDVHDPVERKPACRPMRAAPAAAPCVMGVAPSRARLDLALVGDSHTEAWSAALAELVRANRWRVTLFNERGCAMTQAVYQQEGIKQDGCVPAYRETIAWLRAHREIDVVLMTHEADNQLAGPPETVEARKADAYRRTWKRLPRTVRRVIVLRDTPNATQDQLECVARAVKAGRAPAGPQCSALREQAIPHPDAAVVAAQALDDPRYAHVDLNDRICDAGFCYPALGGMLVNLDAAGHMTLTFARTLAPVLLDRLTPLLPEPRR